MNFYKRVFKHEQHYSVCKIGMQLGSFLYNIPSDSHVYKHKQHHDSHVTNEKSQQSYYELSKVLFPEEVTMEQYRET